MKPKLFNMTRRQSIFLEVQERQGRREQAVECYFRCLQECPFMHARPVCRERTVARDVGHPCSMPCRMSGGRPTNVGLGSCQKLNHGEPFCCIPDSLTFQIAERLGSPSPSLEALWYLVAACAVPVLFPCHHRSFLESSGTEACLRRSSTAGVASSTFRPDGYVTCS